MSNDLFAFLMMIYFLIINLFIEIASFVFQDMLDNDILRLNLFMAK